jgi:DNA-binding MarR family transcriptional regulator
MSQVVSSSGADAPIGGEERPEPDPFTPEEFAAWRGMLRVHSAVFRELDRQLLAEHGFGVDSYAVLITLVTSTARRLPIGELGLRRNLSPSGISRSVDRLTRLGLVERATNPDDGRSLLVALTPNGLQRLREAQVTHHRIVRQMLLSHLDRRDLKRLGELWEKAMPGAVSSPTWPL